MQKFVVSAGDVDFQIRKRSTRKASMMKPIHCLISLTCLFALFSPAAVFAQDGGATVITDTATISGAVQITADSPQAIRALLEEPAAIPGGYGNYGMALFWTAIFGGLGGLVFELLRLRGNLILPYRYPKGETPQDEIFEAEGYIAPKRVIDLGFLARVFVGGMAAIAVLLVISPPDRMKLLAMAIIAGSAGASIFDTLRARLQASLAVADAAEVRAKGEKLQTQLDDMRGLIDDLLLQSRGEALPEPAAVGIQYEVYVEGEETTPSDVPAPAAAALVDPSLIDQLSRKLGEAQGTSESMARTRRPNDDRAE